MFVKAKSTQYETFFLNPIFSHSC